MRVMRRWHLMLLVGMFLASSLILIATRVVLVGFPDAAALRKMIEFAGMNSHAAAKASRQLAFLAEECKAPPRLEQTLPQALLHAIKAYDAKTKRTRLPRVAQLVEQAIFALAWLPPNPSTWAAPMVARDLALLSPQLLRGLEWHWAWAHARLQLHALFSHEEILVMYVYLESSKAHPCGLQALTQKLFRKEPNQLTLSEAAYIVGAFWSPRRILPYHAENAAQLEEHLSKGRARRDRVLIKLFEHGFLTYEELQTEISRPPVFHPSALELLPFPETPDPSLEP